MERISNKHDDVEHFLFAELIAASADNGLSIEPLTPEAGSHNTNHDAATADPRGLTGHPSPNGWY